MIFPPDAEYFVLNDSTHSLENFLEHKKAGITDACFTEERCKKIWNALCEIYDENKIPSDYQLRKRMVDCDRDLIDKLCDFHTTRNVAYYRKLLLDKLQELV